MVSHRIFGATGLLDMVASSRRYASVPPRAWPQPRKALLLVKVLLTDTIVQIYRGTFGLIPAALSRPAQSGPGAIGPTRGRMQSSQPVMVNLVVMYRWASLHPPQRGG